MEVQAFLADAVQASGGKLHALGVGWRVLRAASFPARHDRVGIGVIVRTSATEGGNHRLTIGLTGPKGPIAFGRGAGAGSRASMAVTIIGGQMLCLLLTLLITPVVYSYFDDLREWNPSRMFGWMRRKPEETPAPTEQAS